MGADGTSFEIGLGVQGASGVDSAAASLSTLTDRLTASGAAATAAADAVKAGESAYSQAEIAADRAGKALERIGAAATAQQGKLQEALDAGDTSGIERASAKLQNLQARQEEASAKSMAATAAMNEEAAALDRLKDAASAAAAEEAMLSKQADDVSAAEEAAAAATDQASEAAEGGTGNMRMLSSAFGKLGGPLGSLGQQVTGFGGALQKMSKSAGAAGPYVALAVVIVALAAAAVLATVAIVKWGIGMADTARTSALLSDGIAGSVKGGRELDKTIHDLGSKVPQTREELLGMAGDLATSGLKGQALSTALEAAAVKAAKLKWGPDFAKQINSLDNQSARLKANLATTFGGLNIEGVLDGLAKLVALFDSNTESGAAMKALFEGLFQPLVDGIAGFIPKVVSAFLQFEILVLKAAIAIKPFTSKIEMLAKIVGVTLAVAFGVLAVAVFIAALPFLIAVAVCIALVAAFMWLGDQAQQLGASLSGPIKGAVASVHEAFDSLMAKVHAVIDYLTNTPLSKIGSDMVQGLVDGIKNAGGAILTAITGAVQGAIDGAKKLLGINSPSKVFAAIGASTGEGMVGGVDDAAGDVKSSLEMMVTPPDAKGGAAGGGGAAKGGGGNYAGAVFNFYGVEGAEDAEDRFMRLLEDGVAQGGSAVPA